MPFVSIAASGLACQVVFSHCSGIFKLAYHKNNNFINGSIKRTYGSWQSKLSDGVIAVSRVMLEETQSTTPPSHASKSTKLSFTVTMTCLPSVVPEVRVAQ